MCIFFPGNIENVDTEHYDNMKKTIDKKLQAAFPIRQKDEMMTTTMDRLKEVKAASLIQRNFRKWKKDGQQRDGEVNLFTLKHSVDSVFSSFINLKGSKTPSLKRSRKKPIQRMLSDTKFAKRLRTSTIATISPVSGQNVAEKLTLDFSQYRSKSVHIKESRHSLSLKTTSKDRPASVYVTSASNETDMTSVNSVPSYSSEDIRSISREGVHFDGGDSFSFLSMTSGPNQERNMKQAREEHRNSPNEESNAKQPIVVHINSPKEDEKQPIVEYYNSPIDTKKATTEQSEHEQNIHNKTEVYIRNRTELSDNPVAIETVTSSTKQTGIKINIRDAEKVRPVPTTNSVIVKPITKDDTTSRAGEDGILSTTNSVIVKSITKDNSTSGNDCETALTNRKQVSNSLDSLAATRVHTFELYRSKSDHTGMGMPKVKL